MLPQQTPSVTVIDGEGYIFYFLPPPLALKILTRLLKILGPGAGKFLDGGKLSDLLDREAEEAIAPIIEAISERLEEDLVWQTIEQLLAYTKTDKNANLAIQTHFEGKPFHLLKVVTGCLKHNYSDFFKGSIGQDGEKPKPAPTHPEKSTLTGSSGDRSSQKSQHSKK